MAGDFLELAKEIKHKVDMGYHNRDDYPPFALVSWDDRNKYREYIFRIIDEVCNEKTKGGT